MTQSHALPFLAIATLVAGCSSTDSSVTASSSTGQVGSASTASSMASSGSASGGSSADGASSSGSESAAGGGGSTSIAPTVTSVTPVDGAIGVVTNGNASAIFSEAMDCSSLTADTFTLSAGATSVPGTVICTDSTATFWPAAHLADNSTFTATITTGAKGQGGANLAANYAWTFTTGAMVAAGLPVDLGASGNYVILAKTGISTVPTSAITGNLGISPAAAAFITGFSLSADATAVFSRSSQVTGQIFAPNYAVPTPSNLTTAVGDMQLAFTDAAGRAPDVSELGAGNIGGMTLAAGVYKWGTGLLIPTDVTLAGSATDVWIFEIAQNLTVSSGAHIGLSGGALAKNVFWQIAGLVDVGTTAHLEGVVLTQTAVTLHTGASINGRLLAQTAVNLDGNAVVEPAR
jgi:hypothetical protein